MNAGLRESLPARHRVEGLLPVSARDAGDAVWIAARLRLNGPSRPWPGKAARIVRGAASAAAA